ncbi:MAG: chloride channel protein [Rhizobiales bacterium]|nr:chloride channel protein [Hyphomicrobiales bacterium]
MASSTLFLEMPSRLRALVRARESALIAIAVIIGAASGLLVVAMSNAVELLHVRLFGIPPGTRLSAQIHIDPLHAVVIPTVGGLILGLVMLLLLRWRPAREIDPIEANALHGGYMSFRGSVIVALQTVWSSGVGGSVGLEAGYTQLASGVASSFGRAFHLRRADQRIMVGCGAAAAIAGAFNAPLAGAFYAFELVLGSYTPASLAPIGVSAVIGYAVTHAIAPLPLGISVGEVSDISGRDIFIAGAFGVICGLTGIAIMRGVALWDALLSKVNIWQPLRPAVGGLAVGLLALVTPQVMASGHGALKLDNMSALSVAAIAMIFVLKALASIASLGSGFRGGLFFASLLLGSLAGHLFASGLSVTGLTPDFSAYTIIGMSALSASIIGGPLTMSFLTLEATGNFLLTTAVLAAVIISMQVTRELFGYTFATWRFHLRGETIRSAADVGWIRDLTVRRMMRSDVVTANADIAIDEFRRRFPLGSKTQIVAVNADGTYAGIVFVADAYALESKAAALRDLLRYPKTTLVPGMDVQQAVVAFDTAEAESLAVIDPADGMVIGLLTEAHTLRRYTEELDRRRRDME